MHQLRATTVHSHVHHCLQPGTHLYSWVNWGIVDRMKMPKLRNGSKGDSNPGSLDRKSDILPLSYRTPQSGIFKIRRPTYIASSHTYTKMHVCVRGLPNEFFLNSFSYDLGSAESQLYSRHKITKPLQKMTELWHIKTHRGKKNWENGPFVTSNLAKCDQHHYTS